jgi:ATP-dependent DNA ligase
MWDSLSLDVFMKMWKDEYNGDYEQSYQTRLYDVAEFVHAVRNKKFINMVMSKRVESYEEAQDFYAFMRKEGKEGAVLKNVTMKWKNGTSTDQIKMKNVSECELEIEGWEPGKEDSKYEMCMGSLRCRTRDSKLKVNVGGGFSDAERELDWEMCEGEIISVEFESVIQDKRNKDKYSLFLPRYNGSRPDRSEADSLEEILSR